jgi:hypothetical protein
MSTPTSKTATASPPGTYKETGKSMRAAFAHLYEVRGAKIVRMKQYVDNTHGPAGPAPGSLSWVPSPRWTEARQRPV